MRSTGIEELEVEGIGNYPSFYNDRVLFVFKTWNAMFIYISFN